MAIPDYQSVMLPLLELAADSKEHSLREACTTLAGTFGLTEEERKELLPSGQQPVFDNRVGWARTYMKKAGLLESPRRGYLRITPRGLDILGSRPAKIGVSFLEQFPEFQEFRALRRETTQSVGNGVERAKSTPEESLELAYERLRESLADEVLETAKKCSPSFFEQLVVDLIVKMGYGGTRQDAGRAVGQSGDGGIDEIIKQDRLGLDVIYLQAKRWEGQVGRPEVQKFAGALQGHRAKRGIFITTSAFSREAREFANRIDSNLVLIDGKTLAQLMIDHNVGVSLSVVYEVKKPDHDYFTEE